MKTKEKNNSFKIFQKILLSFSNRNFLGGLLTLNDFKQYTSKIRGENDIIYTYLNEYNICGPPPPSGSAVTQAILNIMNE